MPNSSSFFTKLASEYLGGGWVKCCSSIKASILTGPLDIDGKIILDYADNEGIELKKNNSGFGKFISGAGGELTISTADVAGSNTNIIFEGKNGDGSLKTLLTLRPEGTPEASFGGLVTISSTLSALGATVLRSTLSAGGATVLGSSLSVSGDTLLSGNINIVKGLNVTGQTNLSNNLNVEGRTNLLGGLRVTGNSNISGKFELIRKADKQGILGYVL